jgi:hypothetical protein
LLACNKPVAWPPITAYLLVFSSKSTFERFDDELTENAAKVVMLVRALDEYGPQTSDKGAAQHVAKPEW